MSIEANKNREIISNEEQIDKEIKTFESWVELQLENKEALLILSKIDKYVKSDIDLAYDKENNCYKLISNNEDFSDFLTLKQLRITEKILEAYYNNDFNPQDNKFNIISEKYEVLSEWRVNDKWRLLMADWRDRKEWMVDYHMINVTNSDNRNIITDMFDDDLTVLTEIWDSDLELYIDFLNKFIQK